VALLTTLLCACGGDAPRGDAASGPAPEAFRPVALTDAAGRAHDVRTPPTRIVSLVPSASAVLIALAEHDRLVGRTDFDTAQVLQHVASVGGGQEPNLEVLLSLDPDLVIRFHGPQDQRTPEQLDRVGIPHYAIRPDGIQDVRRIVSELGALVGRTRGADSLVSAIDQALAAVQARVAAYPPVRTAFVMGGTPPWVAGPGTFIHELIRIAGGVNVFADLNELYAPVSPEELVARGADVYLLLEGTELDVRVARGVRIEPVGAGVQIPGPNIGNAAFEVARALHPDWVP
jgi:iron complex transport system substrate-binding protein